MKETPLNGRMLAGGCLDGQEYNTQLFDDERAQRAWLFSSSRVPHAKEST